MTTTEDGPLGGTKVLDFTTMMSGPQCTRLLADLGCDVVKVEAPPRGDYNRRRTPTFDGRSRYFAQLNNGKRSIMLNLKEDDDLKVALDLATRADVLVENNRPGVMDRLGIGYEQVRSRNPRIVYASISGYGQEGAASKRAAYAPNINADSGFDVATMRYQPDPSTPPTTGMFVPDVVGALYTTIAVQGALLGRQRSGVGQFIDVSMFDTMVNLMVYEFQKAQLGEPPDRSTYPPVATTDGFVSIAPVTQRMFETLMPVIGRPEMATDRRWATQVEREKNWSSMMAAIQEWAGTRSSSAVMAELEANGIAAARYRSPEEVLADPALARRGLAVPFTDSGGAYSLFNPPFRFADGSVHARGEVASPDLGADRQSVIADWLA